MLAITKQHYNLPNSKMPEHIMSKIIEYSDRCSSIYEQKDKSIYKYDFRTLDMTFQFNFNDIISRNGYDVSPCERFIAVRFISIHNAVFIFNMKGEQIQMIHVNKFNIYMNLTFIPNGELLISVDKAIYSYTFSSHTQSFEQNFTYNLSNILSSIRMIKHNSNDMFCCYTTDNCLYVFNFKTLSFVHAFTNLNTMYNLHGLTVVSSLDFRNNQIVLNLLYIKDTCIYIDLDTMESKLLITFDDQGHRVNKMLLVPFTNAIIGYSSFYRKAYIWDILTGNISEEVNIPMDELGEFSPGGKTLVVKYNKKIGRYSMY